MLLNLLVKPLWLYVEALVQNHIGHTAFGTFSAYYALSFVLLAFADLGLNQYATKEMAQGRAFLQESFPALFGLKTAMTLIFPLAVAGAGAAIGFSREDLWLLFWVAASVALLQLLQLFRSVLQARQLFNTDSLFSILDKALLICMIGALLLSTLSLERYVYGRVLATVLAVALAYLVVGRHTGWVWPRWQQQRLLGLLRGSLPFAFMTLVYGLNEKIDMVLLERLYSGREAGLYAAAYRWVDAVMMYLWTVLPIFFAKFATHQQEPAEQKQLLLTGQVMVAVPVVFVVLVVFFYGDKLFWLFSNSTPAELAAMLRFLQILFISVLIHAIAAIYSTLLTSTGQAKAVSWLVAGSLVLNLGLNLLFIPQFGAEAAAWNTVVCAAFVSVGYMVLLYRRYPFRLPYPQLLRLLALTLLLALAHAGLQRVSDHWWLNCALAGLLLVPGVQLLGLLDLRAFLKLPKPTATGEHSR